MSFCLVGSELCLRDRSCPGNKYTWQDTSGELTEYMYGRTSIELHHKLVYRSSVLKSSQTVDSISSSLLTLSSEVWWQPLCRLHNYLSACGDSLFVSFMIVLSRSTDTMRLVFLSSPRFNAQTGGKISNTAVLNDSSLRFELSLTPSETLVCQARL